MRNAAGVPLNKIVVGKPVVAGDGSELLSGSTLSSFVSLAGKSGRFIPNLSLSAPPSSPSPLLSSLSFADCCLVVHGGLGWNGGVMGWCWHDAPTNSRWISSIYYPFSPPTLQRSSLKGILPLSPPSSLLPPPSSPSPSCPLCLTYGCRNE